MTALSNNVPHSAPRYISVIWSVILWSGALLLCTIIWIAFVWLVIWPDMRRWDTSSIAALHFAPPLLMWFLILMYMRARKIAKTRTLTNPSSSVAANQIAIANESCISMQAPSFIAVAGIGLRSAVAVSAAEHIDNIDPTHVATRMKSCVDCATDVHSHLLYLRERLCAALDDLQLTMEEPFPFPIWFAIPDWLTDSEAHTLLQTAWHEVFADLRKLPAQDHIRLFRQVALHDWSVQLFEAFTGESHLSGLLLLGIDSPLYAVRKGIPIKQTNDLSMASEAAVAILLAHPETMIRASQAAAMAHSDDEPLQIFRTRPTIPAPVLVRYSALTERTSIARMYPPTPIPTCSPGEIKKAFIAACRYAGLKNATEPVASKESGKALTLAAVVVHGERLFVNENKIAMHQILNECEISYDLINSFHGIPPQFGIIGNAGNWMQLAVAVLQTSSNSAPGFWLQEGENKRAYAGIII